ncbi:MAG: gamma-glutamyltransferase family protein [Polyangiaceae bacterium]
MNDLSIRTSLTPALAVTIAGLLLTSIPAMGAYTPSAEGDHVAVATDNPEATRVALQILQSGGNAADATIGAALTLGVVGPAASGLGGGGFALVYSHKDKKVTAVDFREIAPGKIDIEKLIGQHGMGAHDNASRGVAIGVPGEPAGLEWLSAHYGKRPLSANAAPAADVATRGFLIGKHLAEGLVRFKDYVAVSPELGSAFLPGGTPLGTRSLMKRPELARTIRRFGSEGSRPFYTGDIAQKESDAAKAAGGQLTMDDFGRYTVRERAPLTRVVDGRTIATMPAPSAGGLMLLETLQMYGASSSSPLAPMGFGSSAYLHTIAEAMRGAIADRVRISADPDADPTVAAAYEQALAMEQLAARRQKIDPNKTKLAAEFKTREQGTSHIVVADSEGNVVSLTTTVNGPFGARVVAGDTGILLNDQLRDFSVPSDVTGYGVVGLGPNRPRPLARPVSSMTPTIVLEKGEPIMTIGGSGGMRISENVTQATLCRLVFHLDASTCVSSPRISVDGSPDLLVDPEFSEDVRAGLKARGENVKDEKFLGTGVHMIAWDRNASGVHLSAAADPRKLGLAAAQ